MQNQCTLRIATYNIWSGRNNAEIQTRNYDWTAEVISEIGPDIIGLQEVGKGPCYGFPAAYDIEEEVPEYLGKKLGMYSYFAPAITTNSYGYGNALLSKYPIKSANSIKIPDASSNVESRCVLVAEIDVCNGITVLVTHFGLSPEEQRQGIETVLSLIEESKKPAIFMGDLNITPDNEILKPLFERLTDTANGSVQPYTWPSAFTRYTGVSEKKYDMDRRRKVDYIFTTQHFKTLKSDIHFSLASDHLPFVADLEVQDEKQKATGEQIC